jgi:lipopolysaccharide export system permease protein
LPRFDRYILAQLTVAFGFFGLVLVLIYWVNRAVILFDRLIADGQPTSVFLEFTALSLPGIIRLVLPIAAFAASLYVTNRLTDGSELTVIQATGYSPWRLARPFLIFGLAATLLTGILTTVLGPAANHQLRQREAEVAETATASILRAGQFMTPSDGIAFYIRDIPAGGELHDIFLSDRRNPGETITYTASLAYLVRSDRGPQLVMVDGLIQTLRTANQSLLTTSFTDLAYDIGNLIQSRPRDGRSSRELPTRDLLFPSPAIMEETGKTAGELVAEGHDRFAQALLATVGAMLGFATLLVGGFSRFGVWRQVLAAIALVIGVKLIESGTTAAVRSDPDLWLLIYLPSAAGLLGSAGLLAWAGRTRRVRAVPA